MFDCRDFDWPLPPCRFWRRARHFLRLVSFALSAASARGLRPRRRPTPEPSGNTGRFLEASTRDAGKAPATSPGPVWWRFALAFAHWQAPSGRSRAARRPACGGGQSTITPSFVHNGIIRPECRPLESSLSWSRGENAVRVSRPEAASTAWGHPVNSWRASRPSDNEPRRSGYTYFRRMRRGLVIYGR